MRFVLAALLLPLVLALASAPSIDGAFALQHGNDRTNAFLRASADGSDPLARHLDLWLTPKNGTQPIRRYTVDMTKLLHVVVISDDFEHFLHVHPTLDASGHFTIDQKFPAPTTYHVYADGDPSGIGRQVFRFDLSLGARRAQPTLTPTPPTVSVGPYAVALSSTHLDAGRSTSVIVHVTRGGMPARDLRPYLGALAHVVVIDAKDLSYVHVHPMPLAKNGSDATSGAAMSGMPEMEMPPASAHGPSSPDMRLHLALREAGTYKMWFQFRGGTTLYVAPFVLRVT